MMNNRNILALALIVFSSLLFSCSSASNETGETVEIGDVKISKQASDTDVLINDTGFEGKKETVSTFGEMPKGSTMTAEDGSQIDISYDGEGNKVEARYFFNHANLKSLIVVTTAKGAKEVTVFGHNRENKELPPESGEIALTAPADEIARTAGINSTKIQSPSYTVVKNTQPTKVVPVYVPRVAEVPQPVAQPETVEPEQAEKPNIAQSKEDDESDK